MANSILLIDITAVTRNPQNVITSMTCSENAASNVAGAVVGSDGSIDLTAAPAGNITIQWTFAADLPDVFDADDPVDVTPAPFQYNMSPPQASGKTAWIANYNTAGQHAGGNANIFNYSLNEPAGSDDPQIKNRQ